jgi:acyl-CoA reductase-like NAD-dependent aldehyde dehydrogenase
LNKVATAATVNLTPVTLELGGKDPAVILPGTDLDKWCSIWMRGILLVKSTLMNSDQVTLTHARVLFDAAKTAGKIA